MQRYLILGTLLAVALIVFSLLASCGNALATLDAIVSATEAAVPILQAAGVNVPPIVTTYVADVAACVAGQDGAGPTAAEFLKISTCLIGLVVPTLPSGVPQTVGAIIEQIAQDVSAYLQQHPLVSPGQMTATPVFSNKLISQYGKIRYRAWVVRNKLATRP